MADVVVGGVRFVNLTPHEVRVCDEAGNPALVIPPSGVQARVNVTLTEVRRILGIPVYKPVYGEVQGLPSEPEPNTIYVVSSLVLSAIPEKFKSCTVAPNTNPGYALRDEKGNIVGVKGFLAP